MKREIICGIPFAHLGVEAAAEVIAGWLERGGPPQAHGSQWFACVNPHSVEESFRDAGFRRALLSADLVTADGAGIILASWLRRGALLTRVCGPDLFSAVSARLNLRRAGTRVFFLGGTEAALAEIVRRYGQDFPALKVVGTHSPPFRKEMTAADDRECVERINDAGAELVWVGLGAPKQEKWCSRVRSDVTAGVLAPVGGVFDFYSGRVRLPPRWAQRLGLIWLCRLLQEPRRLARRNLDGPRFLARALSSRGERH